MTQKEIALIRESFVEIKEMGEPIVLLFYGRLFDLDPSVRSLFKIGMREQSRKLLEMLGIVIDSLDRFDEIRPRLRELGHQHVAYGVLPHHYETLLGAFVWTLGQALGSDFSPESREAWIAALQLISGEMLRGADHAAIASGHRI